MNTQSEQQLENALIAQLEILYWDRLTIKDEADLVSNLKHQFEAHKRTNLSDAEFKPAQGNVFGEGKILRDHRAGYLVPNI